MKRLDFIILIASVFLIGAGVGIISRSSLGVVLIFLGSVFFIRQLRKI